VRRFGRPERRRRFHDRRAARVHIERPSTVPWVLLVASITNPPLKLSGVPSFRSLI
jgi:hypothetical protein